MNAFNLDPNDLEIVQLREKYPNSYVLLNNQWIRMGNWQKAERTKNVTANGTTLEIAATDSGYAVFEWNGQQWILISNTCQTQPVPPAHKPGPSVPTGFRIQLPCPEDPT